VLEANTDLRDRANYGPRSSQWRYLLRAPIEAMRAGSVDWIDLSDASLVAVHQVARAPCVVRINGLDITLRNKVYQRVLGRYLPNMEGVIANSGPTKRIALQKNVPEDRIRIVFPPAAAPPGHKPTPVPGRLLLLGRLVARKGQVEFVRDVWPLVLAANPAATLHIVGDGALREVLLATIAKAPKADRIAYLGQLTQDALEGEFASASTLVMASRPTPGDFEGFGMVSAEGAVRGVPTASYPTDGTVDAVLDGGTGRIAAGYAASDLAAAIAETLSGRFAPASVAALAEATWGRERFAKQYMAAVRDLVPL